MRSLTTTLAICFGMMTPALADDLEFEITFYLQPDSTGQNTLNKSIQIEGDEVTIEESRNEGRNRYVERKATSAEIALVEKLVRARIAGFDVAGAERPDAPRVEVEFEVDGGATTLEIEEIYPAGSVPDAYVDLQKVFFEDVFE
ncbi:MAG: hypothetical protein AAFR21_17900 [Pseudomonadota bacterium]